MTRKGKQRTPTAAQEPHAQTIADPIHGAILISSDEQAIIDTPAFQRLRLIKQLGNVHLVFPGATHSRFAHSIGVMHTVGLLFDATFKKITDCTDGLLNKAICDLRKLVRIAGLMHDIGHGPLSHHFEGMLKTNQGKRLTYGEWESKDLKIPGAWIKDKKKFNDDKLKHEHFTFGICHILGKKLRFDAQSICSLLDIRISPSAKMMELLRTISNHLDTDDLDGLHACLKALLSSEIDADRIDYLQRDAYFCGIKISAIDLPHLLSSISIQATSETERKDRRVYLELKPNAVATVEQILISRKQMFNQVYNHRLNGSFDKMLDIAMLQLIKGEELKVPTTYDAFVKLTDDILEQNIKNRIHDRKVAGSDFELAVQMFSTRTPLKRIYEEVVSYAKQAQRKAELEQIFPDKLIVSIELKAFTKIPRSGNPESSQVLRVGKYGIPNVPAEPIGVASSVIASNLWSADQVRLVVFESMKNSANIRNLARKLQMAVSDGFSRDRKKANTGGGRQSLKVAR